LTFNEESEVYFGVFLGRNIFLSPEGYIKVYLYHLHPRKLIGYSEQRHLLYYHMMGSDSR
jgi:hypothetical protein